jgi:hypothetical protein
MQVKSKIPTETDLKPASGLYGLDLKVLIYGLSYKLKRRLNRRAFKIKNTKLFSTVIKRPQILQIRKSRLNLLALSQKNYAPES